MRPVVTDATVAAGGSTDGGLAPIVVRRLGLVPYAATLDAMRAFTLARSDATADELWLLEHPPVYTLGQAGRVEHVRADAALPVIRTERGGQVTHHAPGQLVAYVLVDLRRRGIKVRELVVALERAVIDVLATYNLAGELKSGAPGVYVAHDGVLQKVAALGLRIANGRSFHGLSLNVAMDLAPYAFIDACGDPGLKSVDLATLGVDASIDEVGERLAGALAAALAAATR